MRINSVIKLENSNGSSRIKILIVGLGLAVVTTEINALTGDQNSGSKQSWTQTDPTGLEASTLNALNLTFGLRPDYERLEISPLFVGEFPNSLSLMEAQSDFSDLVEGRIDMGSLLKKKIADTWGSLPLGVSELQEIAREDNTKVFQYTYGSIPFCHFRIRFHRFQNGDVSAMGNIPRIDHSAIINKEADWPSLDSSFELTKDFIERDTGGVVLNGPQNPQKCFTVSQGRMIPTWKFTLLRAHEFDGNESFQTDVAIADENTVYKHDAFEFDVTGKVRTYPFNSVKTPSVIVDSLENLTGDGTLTSDILESSVMSPLKRVQSSNHEFLFDPSSSDFGEVSAFTHATKHLKFLMSVGFQWYGPKPLKLTVFASTLKNNARFVPQISETIAGQIDIGTSDGKLLKNLELDSDVVSHEVGHFAIYRSVRSTSGESLVLHEGLADYFTFARSNDACLAESICPADSPACIRQGQCLRSGEINLKFNDETWKQWFDVRRSLNHLHGQIISGFLWDLREKQIAGQSLDRLVMASINLLPEDADFSHFLLALASADKSLFGGVNLEKLNKAAQNRNLGDRFPSIGTNGGLTKSVVTEAQVAKEQLSGQANNQRDEQVSPSPTTKNRGGGGGGLGCAVVARGVWPLKTDLGSIVILLLLPIGLALAPLRRTIRIRVKRISRRIRS